MRHFLLVLCIIVAPLLLWGQDQAADSTWFVTNYTKQEVSIPMRDGKRLFTTIYAPLIAGKHPILLTRTPYSCAPYGKQYSKYWASPKMRYARDYYIFVTQDVRGCFMSEGEFMDVRPYIPIKKGIETDEATDTYDAIDWLVKNVKNNNGKVGVYGISYPGFYSTMAALSHHPALKAVSPQAPVTEWFLGDDFHHNGAFMMMDAFGFYSGFGKTRRYPTTSFRSGYQFNTKDNYDFYLSKGPLKNLTALLGDSIRFWNDLMEHPNYDEWWKKRNARNYTQYIPSGVPTLVVGGLFDAEDCYGAWNLYKAIENKAPNNNRLVMGPWSHGGWSRGTGEYLGNVRFGSKTAEWYQINIEKPFMDYYLNGKGSLKNIKEANIFFSGTNKWKTFNRWPPVNKEGRSIYLHGDGSLSWAQPHSDDENKFKKYVSDPAKPVPYTQDVHMHRTNEYMDDDQRFAARRPDVLVFKTEPLQADVTLAGPVVAELFTSISTTDADFVVKLIDVFPDTFSYKDTAMHGNGKDYPMGGYQMLVRGEIMRGRYRNSFEKPEAFEPYKITEVSYKLPDVAHVFQKGHRIMVQIQSSWFPLADRNPQQFVDIYHCSESDFVPSEIKVYTSKAYPSRIILPVIR
jgi:uncharacterized protein